MSVPASSMEAKAPSEELRIIIFAPFGQDAALMAQMLSNANLEVACVSDMEAFAKTLTHCAVGLLTTEGLTPENIRQLQTALQMQPPWSDIPLVLLTASIDTAAYRLLAGALGNVTIVQRPLDTASLLTILQTALRARQKQYQVRDLIAAGEVQQAKIATLNEHLLLAIDTARLGTWQLDLQTGILDCSPRCKANFGLAPEVPFNYDQLVAMIVPEDRKRMQEAVKQAIETHSLYEIEYRIHWPDGSLQWIVASGRALYDEWEKPLSMAGVTLKVTDRKQSEEALRASKESLELAIEGAQLGTFYCEMPLNKIVWNDICKDHFFLPYDAEIDFDLFYSRLHPDDREPTRHAIECAMLSHIPYNVEYRTVAPDRRMRWINASGKFYYTEDGEPTRFDGITIDITEKKTRERTLNLLVEINDVTRDMQEPEVIMLAVARLLGEFLGVSRCAYAPVEEDNDHFNIYGDYTNGCKSIVGRYPLTAFGSKAYGDLCAGQTYVIADIDQEIPSGEELTAYRQTEIQAVICTSLVKNNKMVGLMAVHQTTPRRWTPGEVQLVEMVSERSWAIIERARADKELKKRAEEIKSLNARLIRSMQETHHRVKNNLQVISAMIEMQMIEHGTDKTIPIEEYQQLKAHIHTLAIVHDLLSANIKEEEDAQRVSTKAVLERLLPMLEQMAWNKAVRYSVADARLTTKLCISLSLILNELVTNAFKHGRSQAEVVFSVEGTEGQLRVLDDGAGFPEGFDPLKASNMGLELVESLVRTDLKGQSTYGNRSEGGGIVKVIFPLPGEDEEATSSALS